MNLAEWLVRTARRLPNTPALLSGKNFVADYAEFARRVANLASALQARLGIRPGDRVAIVMSNCVEYLELLYATWFAGAAVVPINFKLHAKEAAWIIENAEAKAVFVFRIGRGRVNSLDRAIARTCCRPRRGAQRILRIAYFGANVGTGLTQTR